MAVAESGFKSDVNRLQFGSSSFHSATHPGTTGQSTWLCLIPKKFVVSVFLAELLSGLHAALVDGSVRETYNTLLVIVGPLGWATIADQILRKANSVSSTICSVAEHICEHVQAKQPTLMASGGVNPTALPKSQVRLFHTGASGPPDIRQGSLHLLPEFE